MEDLARVEVVDVSIFLFIYRGSILIIIIRWEPAESRRTRLRRKPRQYAFFFLETRPLIEFIVSLAGEKPGLMGKAKHLYEDIKGGSGGNQQGSQGGGDNLF